MAAEPVVWVDVESAIREWARDNIEAVSLGPSSGRRVFFGFNNHAGLPQIALFRIAGRDDACLIQFDVWAKDKAQAIAAANELSTAADNLSRYAHDGTLLLGAFVESVRWQPDEESTTPRYIVEATFTAVSGG